MHVMHIRITTDETMTWCNYKLQDDNYYRSAELAALNGRFEHKTNVCGDCIDAVTEALENGRSI